MTTYGFNVEGELAPPLLLHFEELLNGSNVSADLFPLFVFVGKASLQELGGILAANLDSRAVCKEGLRALGVI